MHTLKKLLLLLTLSCSAGSLSVAGVAFQLEGEYLNTSAGAGNPAPTSSLVLLVADTAQDGFGLFEDGSSTSLGSLLNVDDKVVFAADLSGLLTPGLLFAGTPPLTLDSITSSTTPDVWSPDDPLGIAWFPSLSLSDTSLSNNSAYGLLNSGTNASDAFVTPADGTGGHLLRYLSTEASPSIITGTNGTGAPTAASFTTITEPSSVVLLLGGIAALNLLRRPRRES